MRTRIGLAAVLLAALLGAGPVAAPAWSQDKPAGKQDAPYKGITVQKLPLPDPLTDVLGRRLDYPAGPAKINAYVITLPPGAETSWHMHPVPLFAYMLSGELEVDYGTKGTKRYRPGDAFMEAVDWCHKGHTVGDAPAKLLAVYLANPKLKDAVACPK